MDTKWVTLPCPHCQFPHSFKRICWWTTDEGGFIGSYGTDDPDSRKSCSQEVVFGTASYKEATKRLEGDVK